MFSLSILLFLSAAFCLYYGLVMLFLVPGYPGESYWHAHRIHYGVVPVLFGLVLFAAGLCREPPLLILCACTHILDEVSVTLIVKSRDCPAIVHEWSATGK
jgi:hypothetical protein